MDPIVSEHNKEEKNREREEMRREREVGRKRKKGKIFIFGLVEFTKPEYIPFSGFLKISFSII